MADEMDRRREDLAGAMAGSTQRVAPLGSLHDYEVADDFPDPRGWDVLASDGQRIGKVHELIVDTAALRTRYLDVELDEQAALNRNSRDVLIPVGAARLDDRNDNVILDSMDMNAIADLPVYEHAEITREYETSIVTPFSSSTGSNEASAAMGDSFYTGKNFDDGRFYSSRWGARRTGEDNEDDARLTRSKEELAIAKRRVQAGEVNVSKHVETDRVSEPVNLRREEITVERQPVSDGFSARNADITEDEMRKERVDIDDTTHRNDLNGQENPRR